MKVECSECGCIVERGVRITPCPNPQCCCHTLPIRRAMAAVASADHVGELLRNARLNSLPPAAIAPDRADELVAAVRASRAAR